MSLSFKEIFNAAKEEISDLYNVEDSDFRLEQIEFNQKDEIWDIVVSYLIPNKNSNPSLLFPNGMPFERIFKKLRINTKKEVEGIYIFDNKK